MNVPYGEDKGTMKKEKVKNVNFLW